MSLDIEAAAQGKPVLSNGRYMVRLPGEKKAKPRTRPLARPDHGGGGGMKLGDHVIVHDDCTDPDCSCDGVTGVIVEFDDDPETPGVIIRHDSPWEHMDGNWYRLDEVEVAA